MRHALYAKCESLASQTYHLYDLNPQEFLATNDASNFDILLNQDGIFIYAIVYDGKLIIASRGTQLDSSITANLDPNGPAYGIIKDNSAELLALIDHRLAAYDLTDIYLTGHSLGGAISQTLAYHILGNIEQTEGHTALKQLQNIHLVLFQSLGINPSGLANATEMLETIKQTQDLQVNLCAHIAQNDPISMLYPLLFADAPPETVNIDLIIKSMAHQRDVVPAESRNTLFGFIWQMAQPIRTAHCSHFYDETPPTIHLNNQNPLQKQRIDGILTRHAVSHASPDIRQYAWESALQLQHWLR